jgi:bifunctional DNA-binding transcriptional regulator/antitoxin component of YhaV-PrlF toxin-antitoxin module
MATVTVSPESQIVIPENLPERLLIAPGDEVVQARALLKKIRNQGHSAPHLEGKLKR